MNDKYINDLIEALSCTEIWSGAKCKCLNYHDGIKLLVDTFTAHKKNNSQLFFIGNGGSSAIASHMTADFMKNGGMNTYSLYDNAVTTCMGNDYGYEYIFSRPMEFLVREGRFSSGDQQFREFFQYSQCDRNRQAEGRGRYYIYRVRTE